MSSGADFIIGVGGGSPIDASKAMSYWIHERDSSRPYVKQIAIPTTLSAAEYTVRASTPHIDIERAYHEVIP